MVILFRLGYGSRRPWQLWARPGPLRFRCVLSCNYFRNKESWWFDCLFFRFRSFVVYRTIFTFYYSSCYRSSYHHQGTTNIYMFIITFNLNIIFKLFHYLTWHSLNLIIIKPTAVSPKYCLVRTFFLSFKILIDFYSHSFPKDSITHQWIRDIYKISTSCIMKW